ncbi:MAG: methyltransferase [Chloroflexota bacterium]
MMEHDTPAPVTLLQMMTGYWVSQSVYVAAKLGIADLVADGAKTSEELAQSTGAHAPSLYRLLRGLAGVGVFTDIGDGRFALTPLATLLRIDLPGSMRALAITYCEEQYRAWGDLLHSVQTGETAFNHAFGTGFFEYVAQHPRSSAVFNDAMTSWSTQVAAAVVAASDFSGISRIVDVGGGHGTIIAAILQAQPAMRGVLFDLPHVVGGAKERLEAAGIADRCETVGGDFFEAVPSGGDAYVLAQILHDWDDARCMAILKQCHRAMTEQAKLLVVELVLPPGNDQFFGKLLDLHMLVMAGGRERTADEYRLLFASAGFRLTSAVPTQAGASVIGGVRA